MELLFACSEESKNAVRIFNEQIAALQSALDEAEHTLNTRLNSPIPRDVDSLEHMVIQHKDFETRLKVCLYFAVDVYLLHNDLVPPD